MLQFQTISPDCKELLLKLTSMSGMKRFRLVGGTSLALQLGHRTSVDLDFFTDKTFDELELENALRLHFPDFQIVTVRGTGFSAIINGVKCDFYNWSVPFIRPVLESGGLSLAHLEDIAPMKLDTIYRRQEKKDFIDIYVLLQRYTLREILGFYREKYPFQDVKPVMESLKVPGTADSSPSPEMLLDVSWEQMKNAILVAWNEYFEAGASAKEKALQARIAKAQQLLDKKTPPDA